MIVSVPKCSLSLSATLSRGHTIQRFHNLCVCCVSDLSGRIMLSSCCLCWSWGLCAWVFRERGISYYTHVFWWRFQGSSGVEKLLLLRLIVIVQALLNYDHVVIPWEKSSKWNDARNFIARHFFAYNKQVIFTFLANSAIIQVQLSQFIHQHLHLTDRCWERERNR